MTHNPDKDIVTLTGLFAASVIDGSGDITSYYIDLDYLKPEGYFTLKLTTAGVGSAVKVEYLICDTQNGTYYTPYGVSPIISDHAPGTVYYEINPVMAKFLKIKLTEMNGSNVTGFSASLMVQ